jgi:hypothetical protein
MLSVAINSIMLSIVMLNVIMLSVVALFYAHSNPCVVQKIINKMLNYLKNQGHIHNTLFSL